MIKKIRKKIFFILALLNFNAFCMQPEDLEEYEDDRTELSNFHLNGHQLSAAQYQQITNTNQHLNQSPLFRTINLKNTQWLQAERDSLDGQEIQLQTQDGCLVTCWHFKKGKDKVILIAPGFGGGFEEMMPLVEIYKDYDVLLLDYWGHGAHDAIDQSKTKWYRNPANRFFSERFHREHLDILAALAYLNTHEETDEGYPYQEIIGAGNCYSTLILSEVQARQETAGSRAFDKLIFDSCWLSTNAVAHKVAHDPYLSFDQIHGNAPWIIQKFMNTPYLDKGLLKLGEVALGIDLQEHSILKHIGNISCPILFIHGTADKLVTNKEFRRIVKNCNAPKMILITPFEHSVGRFKGKEIYKFMVDLFINNRAAFDTSIRPSMLIASHLNEYDSQTEPFTHTNMIVTVPKKKFFNVKNSIVTFITLMATAYVWYILASANNSQAHLPAIVDLQ